MSDITPPEEQNVFLTSIGYICLQWALLEQMLIAIIAAAENQSLEKAYARYGTLDIFPRLNMAIKLTREAKWPQRLIKPLVDIRKALQDGIANRRNLFVHGVHEPTGTRGEYALTMVRWAPEKRKTVVNALDAGQLTLEILRLTQKAEAVFTEYGMWKFGPEYETDRSQQIAETRAAIRRLSTKQIKRALKLLVANLKPW